jgi:iron uptake system component EfeO
VPLGLALLTAADIDGRFASVDATLKPYQRPDGTWAPFDHLSDADKQQLSADIAALSESMARLPGTLGLA